MPFFVVTDIDDKSNTGLTVFRPTHHKPVREARLQMRIDQVCLLPSTSTTDINHLQFAGIAKTGEICRFGDAVAGTEPPVARAVGQATTDKPLSIWQEMFGKDAFLEELKPAATTAPPPRTGRLGRPSDVFEGPSHTMPPVGLLFDAFMDELLAGHETDKAIEGDPVVTNEILYEQPAPAYDDPPVPSGESKSHTITDGEVRELEAFFREILVTSKRFHSIEPVSS